MVTATEEGIFIGTTVDLFRPLPNNTKGNTREGSGGSFKLLTDEDDETIGSAGSDSISGLKGRDSIDGRGGRDIIYGNEGSDTLLGRSGDDSLFGNQGKDSLLGNEDQDILWGGKDNDFLDGDDDQDTLMNVSEGEYTYDSKAFENISQTAKDFIDDLLKVSPR